MDQSQGQSQAQGGAGGQIQGNQSQGQGQGHSSLAEVAVVPDDVDSPLNPDCQTVFGQLGVSSHFEDMMKGAPNAETYIYADILDDLKDLGTGRVPGSRAVDDRCYFGLSRISSCYRKHTQSSASQAQPLFKLSFTDSSDRLIKLMEFTNESEYWVFHQHYNRAIEGTFTNASGECYFSINSQGHTSGAGSHYWTIENDNLRVKDNRGSILCDIAVRQMTNVSFSFDYCLPTALLDLRLQLHQDDAYNAYQAHIALDSASLDVNNAIDCSLSLDQTLILATLPLYHSAEAVPKMRVKVLETGIDLRPDSKAAGLVAVESLGEGSAHFNCPIPPSFADQTNQSRRENLLFNQTLFVDIQSPQDIKRSIHIAIHSAHFKIEESTQKSLNWKRMGRIFNQASSSSSFYCVVYALDTNGNKITPKNDSSSTSALAMKIGENNPIWNEEFDLYTPDIVDTFDAIRIKLKVHNSGLLKDRNLGMVTIRAKDLFHHFPDRTESVKMKQVTPG